MPTRYVDILAISTPFPIGLDTNGRTQFSCNYVATCVSPNDDFKNEILRLISDASLGTKGTNLFVGRFAKIPIGDGPYVQFIETTGFPPLETHNGSKYLRRGFQIIVVAAVYSVAETRANAIWQTLDGVRNETITPLS